MLYPYITFADNTEITHSKIQADGSVKVYIEKPVQGGFINATCLLPSYKWLQIDGYSEAELVNLETVIRHNAHLIFKNPS